MIELFKLSFISFTLLDLIDIMFITMLFYGIYRSLKDTIAVQILIGLIIIAGLQFITEAVNLRGINWIMKTISSIWLIAFIVLFQPEMRRLLMQITRSKIFRLFVKTHIFGTIEEVIEAAIEFSEKHTGALIVFARTQNVQMTVDTGITLNAQVTRELLVSIFNTKSPLHDGAVIIENNVIIAARCVLPLTNKERYGTKALGTRHRAGLGLSEQIDALILIVSEETGGISIADGGELIYDIQSDVLPEMLRLRLYS